MCVALMTGARVQRVRVLGSRHGDKNCRPSRGRPSPEEGPRRRRATSRSSGAESSQRQGTWRSRRQTEAASAADRSASDGADPWRKSRDGRRTSAWRRVWSSRRRSHWRKSPSAAAAAAGGTEESGDGGHGAVSLGHVRTCRIRWTSVCRRRSEFQSQRAQTGQKPQSPQLHNEGHWTGQQIEES